MNKTMELAEELDNNLFLSKESPDTIGHVDMGYKEFWAHIAKMMTAAVNEAQEHGESNKES